MYIGPWPFVLQTNDEETMLLTRKNIIHIIKSKHLTDFHSKQWKTDYIRRIVSTHEKNELSYSWYTSVPGWEVFLANFIKETTNQDRVIFVFNTQMNTPTPTQNHTTYLSSLISIFFHSFNMTGTFRLSLAR